jgi:hypothetical protein
MVTIGFENLPSSIHMTGLEYRDGMESMESEQGVAKAAERGECMTRRHLTNDTMIQDIQTDGDKQRSEEARQ